jgi:hypothetical protein
VRLYRAAWGAPTEITEKILPPRLCVRVSMKVTVTVGMKVSVVIAHFIATCSFFIYMLSS